MLYKYITAERVDVLQNLKVRFTPYNQLNDPYECRFVLNPIPRERRKAKADDYEAEWVEVERWLQTHVGQLGMLCLSRTSRNLLMWSHYAANHSGLVVAFDEQHDFFKHDVYFYQTPFWRKVIISLPGFGTLRDLTYSQERSVINLGEGVPFDSFFRKSLDWSYEQEVRIFRTLEEANEIHGSGSKAVHLFNLPPELIRQVIIGAQAGSKMEQQILDATQKSGLLHVQIDKATLDPREFNITFKTLRKPKRTPNNSLKRPRNKKAS